MEDSQPLFELDMLPVNKKKVCLILNYDGDEPRRNDFVFENQGIV